MVNYSEFVETKKGVYKKRILDLANYINPISKEKEIFTRESIGKMTTNEYLKNEKKILMQMNSVGIPSDEELSFIKSKNFDNDKTVEWVWVLDDSLKNHCEFCQSMEGQTFKNKEDAPEIPIHKNCGCELIKSIIV